MIQSVTPEHLAVLAKLRVNWLTRWTLFLSIIGRALLLLSLEVALFTTSEATYSECVGLLNV